MTTYPGGALSLVGEIGHIRVGSSRQEGDRHWMVRLCLRGLSHKGGPQGHNACLSVWPEAKTGVLLSDLRQVPQEGPDGHLGWELWLLPVHDRWVVMNSHQAVLSLEKLHIPSGPPLCPTPPHSPTPREYQTPTPTCPALTMALSTLTSSSFPHPGKPRRSTEKEVLHLSSDSHLPVPRPRSAAPTQSTTAPVWPMCVTGPLDVFFVSEK